MTANSLRWGTLQALENSPKAKITFDPHWSDRGEDILSGCKESLGLSPRSGLILDRLGLSLSHNGCPRTSGSLSFSEEVTASVSSTESNAAVDSKHSVAFTEDDGRTSNDCSQSEDLEPEASELSSAALPPAISLLSPKAMQVAGCIIQFQQQQREKAKSALKVWQEEQERLVATVASAESEQLKRFEELTELKQRQEYQSMRDMMDREAKESIGRQEKMKEEQRNRMKILKLRLREAEQQRLRAEVERQRQAEGRERLRNLNTIQEEVLQLNKLLDPSTQSKLDVSASGFSSFSGRGNQLCSQVSEVVRKTAEGEFPSVEDMSVAEQTLRDMRALIQLMQEEVAKAQEQKKKEKEEEEKLKKQAQLKAQQEAQQAAQQVAKEKAKKKGLQNTAEDGTIKWYKELQELAAQCARSIDPLSSAKDTQTKKQKLELQKAATIPVSQIATDSGSQIREIFDKIDKLLSGRAVMSGGRSVSTSQHPQGLDFVSYKLAEKFVKQGEEEVAAHHEAAFPIGVVASGIWELHPRVGELFLAHLHTKCPYSIPHYPPMKEGTPLEEYQRILGYRVNDDGVEGQDSFLKRMSGMIRLYAAVIQQRWPYGSKQGAAPHGLNHGWRWLAQMLNMEPLADITATLLFDFLEVCGHALMKQYQAQFWKLILLLKEEYFPRIEAVTDTGQMGSVIRLKQFLEASLQRRQISPPKGQLSATFWRS